MLKSGCGIEDLAHKTAERLKRAIAINLVIGWRIMLMTLLGRTCPELPAEVLFSDLEVRVLRAYAEKKLKPTGTTGRRSTLGSQYRRIPGARQRPTTWSSIDVARVFLLTAHVRGLSARRECMWSRVI